MCQQSRKVYIQQRVRANAVAALYMARSAAARCLCVCAVVCVTRRSQAAGQPGSKKKAEHRERHSRHVAHTTTINMQSFWGKVLCVCVRTCLP